MLSFQVLRINHSVFRLVAIGAYAYRALPLTKGLAEGLAEGLAKGLAEGLAKGFAEGFAYLLRSPARLR